MNLIDNAGYRMLMSYDSPGQARGLKPLVIGLGLLLDILNLGLSVFGKEVPS